MAKKKLTLLPAAELLNLLLLIHHLGVEGHTDADASVIIHAGRLIVRLLGGAALGLAPVGLALNDQSTVPSGDELLKDGGKFLGDLLERAFYGFVLGLVQMLDQLFNRRVRRVELLAPLKQLVPLRGEVCVLIKGLLVDVLVLFEGLVDLSEPRLDLHAGLAD